jgi:hypothetical protein
VFRYGFSERCDEDLFDDENGDILDTDLDELPDPDFLSDLEDPDQEFYQKIRNRSKSGKKDRSEGDKKSKKKRRRQNEKINRRDPDWDDFKG